MRKIIKFNYLMFLLLVTLVGCTKTYEVQVLDDGIMLIDAMKDGIHIAKDSEGNVIYKGEFKGGLHTGEHVYYYAKDSISRRVVINEDGKTTIEDYTLDGQHVLTQIVYPDSKYLIRFKDGCLVGIEKYSKAIKFGEPFAGEIFLYSKEGFLIKKTEVKDGKTVVIYDETMQ